MPNLTKLVDGTEVRTDSEEWRAECEARYVLSMDVGRRFSFMDSVRSRRGSIALARLEKMVSEVEPDYVLRMPSKDARHAYLAKIARLKSDNAAEHLRSRVLTLHHNRKATQAAHV